MFISRQAYQSIQATLESIVADSRMAALGRTQGAVLRRVETIETTMVRLRRELFDLDRGASPYPGEPTMPLDAVGLQLIRARLDGLILDCQTTTYSATKDDAVRQVLVVATRTEDLKLVVDQHIYPDGPSAA